MSEDRCPTYRAEETHCGLPNGHEGPCVLNDGWDKYEHERMTNRNLNNNIMNLRGDREYLRSELITSQTRVKELEEKLKGMPNE